MAALLGQVFGAPKQDFGNVEFWHGAERSGWLMKQGQPIFPHHNTHTHPHDHNVLCLPSNDESTDLPRILSLVGQDCSRNTYEFSFQFYHWNTVFLAPASPDFNFFTATSPWQVSSRLQILSAIHMPWTCAQPLNTCLTPQSLQSQFWHLHLLTLPHWLQNCTVVIDGHFHI